MNIKIGDLVTNKEFYPKNVFEVVDFDTTEFIEVKDTKTKKKHVFLITALSLLKKDSRKK